MKWINIKKEGQPTVVINTCIIWYLDDYEFGAYNGLKWFVYLNDELVIAQEVIDFYSLTNRPDENELD